MRRPLVLALAGWGLLLGAWTWANPPFAGPDESDHYVRAFGLGDGDLVGAHPPPGLRVGINPRAQAFVRQTARLVTLPAGLAPEPFNCVDAPYATSSVSPPAASCLNRARPTTTPTTNLAATGIYPPTAYVLPGAAEHLASSAPAADRLGRTAAALVNLALLAVAAVAVEGALLGLLIAATPMVIFLGAIVNPSGLEVIAAIAFVASLLRVARAGRGRGPLALSGAILAFSRGPGPLWLAVELALVAALVGPRLLVRRLGRPVLAVLAVAVVGNWLWTTVYGPSIPVYLGDIRHGATAAVRTYAHAVPGLIGHFGYLDWRLPLWVYLLWGALAAGIVGSAAVVGARRGRIVLLWALGGAAVLPPLFWLFVVRGTGSPLQGRYVLPALASLPILAGELLRRCRVRPIVGWGVGAGVGLGQFAALYFDAHRAAVGVTGPLIFVGRAQWSPPLGWTPWLIVGALGACALALAGGLSVSRRSAEAGAA